MASRELDQQISQEVDDYNDYNTYNSCFNDSATTKTEEDGKRVLLSRLSTSDELQEIKFPPMRWAVPDLIPEGYGLLVGSPKIGKSWLTLSIALAVATGGQVLEAIRTGPARPVLLLALEDGPRRLQERIEALLEPGARFPRLLTYSHDPIPANEAVATVKAWMEDNGDSAPLVILDTLGAVLPQKKASQSGFQFDYQVGRALKAVSDQYPGSTFLVVHHDRKMKSDDWMEGVSGSNGVNGAADFTIYLTRDRNSDQGAIHVTGRDVEEKSVALIWCAGTWVLDGENLEQASERLKEYIKQAKQQEQAKGFSSNQQDLLKYVNANSGVTPAQVAEVFNVSPQVASVNLGRLYKAKAIDKAGRGVFVPLQHEDTNKTSVVSVVSVVSPSQNGISESEQLQQSVVSQQQTPPICPVCNTPNRSGQPTHPSCELEEPLPIGQDTPRK